MDEWRHFIEKLNAIEEFEIYHVMSEHDREIVRRIVDQTGKKLEQFVETSQTWNKDQICVYEKTYYELNIAEDNDTTARENEKHKKQARFIMDNSRAICHSMNKKLPSRVHGDITEDTYRVQEAFYWKTVHRIRIVLKRY